MGSVLRSTIRLGIPVLVLTICNTKSWKFSKHQAGRGGALYILVTSERIKLSEEVPGKEITGNRDAKSHKKCQDDLFQVHISFLVWFYSGTYLHLSLTSSYLKCLNFLIISSFLLDPTNQFEWIDHTLPLKFSLLWFALHTKFVEQTRITTSLSPCLVLLLLSWPWA